MLTLFACQKYFIGYKDMIIKIKGIFHAQYKLNPFLASYNYLDSFLNQDYVEALSIEVNGSNFLRF